MGPFLVRATDSLAIRTWQFVVQKLWTTPKNTNLRTSLSWSRTVWPTGLDCPCHKHLASFSKAFWKYFISCIGSVLSPHANAIYDRWRRLDLSWCRITWLGRYLNVDDPMQEANRSSQTLHQSSVGYHPCHIRNLAHRVLSLQAQSRTQATTGRTQPKLYWSQDGVSQTDEQWYCSMTK
jgi:hypothetical protein